AVLRLGECRGRELADREIVRGNTCLGDGKANRDGDTSFLLSKSKRRLLDLGANAFREDGRTVPAGFAGEDEELLTTNPANGIDLANRAGQEPCQPAKDLIASGQEIASVHLLEVIDIHVADRQRAWIACVALQLEAGQVIHGAAVEQAGQRVG